MKGALKVFVVMIVVACAYSALLIIFDMPLALWGSLFVAGLLGMYWFHRARRRPVFKPYILFWILFGVFLWYASNQGWCSPSQQALPIALPDLFCPFPVN